MNGTAHFDEAQRLLAIIEHDHELNDANEITLLRAQVHADLAVAGGLAALIAKVTRGDITVTLSTADSDALDHYGTHTHLTPTVRPR